MRDLSRYIYEMLTTYRDARFMCNTSALIYEILFKYSANNLSKQISQIDYVLEKKSIVSVKCSDIMSDQNVKLAGHIQNLVGQCPMTDCYFQLCRRVPINLLVALLME